MRSRFSPPNSRQNSINNRDDAPPDSSLMQDVGNVGISFAHDGLDTESREPDGVEEELEERTNLNMSESTSSQGQKKGRPAESTILIEESSSKPSSLIIPETQSQSQGRSLSQVEETGQPDSLLVEHGSSAPEQQEDISDSVIDTLNVEKSSFHDAALSLPPQSSLPAATGKQLGPLPRVTPSKFRQHLPVLRRLSSLPRLHFGSPREPPSSIDNTSPVKKARSASPAKGQRVTAPGNGTEGEDEIEDSIPLSPELRQRGLELLKLRRKKIDLLLEERPLPNLSLDEITASRANSQEHEPADEPASLPLFLNSPTGANQESQALAASELPPINIGITEPIDQTNEEQEDLIRQLEQQYIDFSGNAGASVAQISSLASPGQNNLKEEEEVRAMTQELVEEEIAEPPSPQVEAADESSQNDVDPFLADYASRERTPTTTTSQQVV